jgi:Cytochrome P450
MTNRDAQTSATPPMSVHPAATAAKRRLEDLAAPNALPWLGNLHQLDSKRLHAQLEAWGQALGPTYTFKLGPKRILVTSDVEIALSVLRDRLTMGANEPLAPASLLQVGGAGCVVSIAGDVTAPTYAELYSGAWRPAEIAPCSSLTNSACRLFWRSILRRLGHSFVHRRFAVRASDVHFGVSWGSVLPMDGERDHLLGEHLLSELAHLFNPLQRCCRKLPAAGQ